MDTTPTTLDAHRARAWLTEALRALAAVRTRVDVLNVFPVPDSDTGTNVVLTVTAGARQAQLIGDDADLPALTAAVAHGALWGARGNSGIIISQAFQALARTFEGVTEASATDLIRALDAVAIAVRDAVAKPVEGTIITVAREVAEAVVKLPMTATLADVAKCAQAAGVASLATTGERLEAEIGTPVSIDAGAASYVVLLDALAQALGVTDRAPIPWELSDSHPSGDGSCLPDEGEFEVMYVTVTDRRGAAHLRSRLSDIGHSVAVVAGQEDHWHVHVHTDHPQLALPATAAQQVMVRHLQAPIDPHGIVATTNAVGLLEELARCGAVTALAPSRSALVRAIIDCGSTDVTVLPASNALADLAREVANDPQLRAEGIDVHVAPTHNDPQVYAVCTEWGISRLVDSDEDPASIAQACVADTEVRELRFNLADRDASISSCLQTLPLHADDVVTVFVGDSVHATNMLRSVLPVLQAQNIEVQSLAAGQRSPDLWIMRHG